MYTREDELSDQLDQLPTADHMKALLKRLPPGALREWTMGAIGDTVAAARTADLLNVARSINDWVATGEELALAGRKKRGILAAREQRPI